MDRWRCSFFQDISRIILNWYATRSPNNTTIYMDLGESSTLFWILHCLEFYFLRHSVAFLFCPFLFLSLALFFFFPHDSPSRFHPADRFAGHQRGFIPHSGTGVISHGWIGNPLSLRALTSRRLGCSTPSPMPIRPLDGRLCRVWIHAKCVHRADVLHVIARG